VKRKKRRKPPTELSQEQKKQVELDIFNGGIVKQVAFKHGMCLKYAYRIVTEFYEWRLVPKNEEMVNDQR